MIKLYFTSLFYFVIIDTVGIQAFVIRVYRQNLPSNLRVELNLGSAILFYIIFVFGLVYFVIAPQKNSHLSSLIIPSVIYGLVTYATYALTVKAAFNIFNWIIVISDILWGMLLCTLISLLTVYTANKVGFLS